jgi:hypothetical protein
MKITPVIVKGSEIKRIIDRGPDALFKDVQSYVKDCKTLFERMQDLYQASLPVQLVGVKVHLTISTNDGVELFDVEFGATTPEEIKNGEDQRDSDGSDNL